MSPDCYLASTVGNLTSAAPLHGPQPDNFSFELRNPGIQPVNRVTLSFTTSVDTSC